MAPLTRPWHSPFWAVVVAFHAAGSLSAQSPPILTTLPNVFAGDHPKTSTLTEVNSDGAPDLLVTFGPVLGILKGNGLGGLTTATLQTIANTYLAGELLSGDLDGDGVNDAVACNGGSNPNNYSLLGDGAGGFAPAIPWTTGVLAGPFQAALGDVNSDGILDAVVASAGQLSSLAGNALGGFSTIVVVATPPNPTDLALADLDGNGLLDLVYSETVAVNGQVTTALGNGAGAFGIAGSYGTTDPITYLTIHPIHATTPPVLTTLAANATFSTVERQVANGFGGWIAAGSMTLPKASGLASADVNGDAVADILITQNTVFVTPLQQLAVLLGVPGGSFVPNLYGFPASAPASPVAGDLDGNGRVDAVTITPMQFWATVLTNVTPLPAGLANYGASSAGCLGPHGLAATGPPAVGTVAFEFTATAAPPSSLGLLLIGDAPGSGDPLGVGVELHVNVFTSTQVFAVDLPSDSAGMASAYVDIPPNPFLLGQVFFATGAFAWSPPCPATPPFGLSGTNGLQITIQ